MSQAISEPVDPAMETSSTPVASGATKGEPRLMISKIVCRDFKSYAGVQSLGPFHKQFTSVIGPNGSGKSNVIDAILFVFGNRARRIRCKKVSVLIHNSTQHQNLQQCSVSVHFQLIHDLEGDAFEVVPNSQFVISRTALKDNSSYYQINGKKVTFKEVAALLRESGIDIDHNRFLILQGEVEEIALLKPKAVSGSDDGMLEFLEDIIGSSKFKQPIEDLFQRLEELSEDRRNKLNRARVAEKEKNALEGDKNDAENYLALQRNMSHKQYKLYKRYIYECERHELKARQKKEELEAIAASKEEQLAELEGHKKQKHKLLKKEQTSYEKLLEREEQYKQQLTSCEQRDVHARQALKNAKANLKKLSKKLEKEKEKLVELETLPEKLSAEIKQLEKKIGILEKRKTSEEEKLAEVMESMKTATQGMQKEKEGHELKLVDLNQAVNEAKSKLDVAQVELDICKERATSHQRQVREAQESLKETKATIAAKKKEISLLKSNLPSKKKELAKTQSELEKTTAAEQKLSKKLDESRAALQDGRSAFAEHKEKGRILSSLLELKNDGTLPGVHGRLGDLGSIDEKYDVAISTACGPLDHIVVDTMETAVRAVEHLKKHDLGTATFIGLDKMEVWSSKAGKRITMPENVHRLFDLINFKDPSYRNVFYFALKDTLVADNLEQATRIGLKGSKRYRVVTLAGQLVDLSGTMSGGGGKACKGRMSKKLVPDITPQQLAAIEKTFSQDEKLYEECHSQRLSLEERVKALTSEITEAVENISKLEKNVELLAVKEEGIVGRIAELEAADSGQDEVDPEQLARLERDVAQFSKQHNKAAEAANKVKAQVQKLHDKIMEVSGSKMQQQQAQVDAICSEIDASQAAITKASVSLKTNDRNLTKCQKLIKSLDNELSDTNNKIEEVKGQLTALEEEAQEVLDNQTQLKEECDVAYAALDELKKEMEGIESDVTKIQTEMVDMKHELEQYATKMRENHGRIKHFNSEINRLDLGEDPQEPSETDLATMDKQIVEYEITVLEEQLKQMSPNMGAIEEYKRKDELHQARLRELDEVTAERDRTREEYDGLKKKRLDHFMAGFSAITNKLKEVYQMITMGGDAELELVDSLDPFSEGIAFSVRPPRKSWKNIVNLSGGEKTLSSLALVFALHHYKPSPFYVMDEIDAALDFRNVSIIAYYVKEQTKDAQFIIISLRNNMFEQSDRLVGIYKTNDTSKSCAIDPRIIQNHITTA